MIKRIEDIDPNFKSSGIQLYFEEVRNTAASLEGLAGENYCRFPESLLPSLSEGVRALAYHTSGGIVRFRTKSRCLGLWMKLRDTGCMNHMPLTGSAGMDVFTGEEGALFYRGVIRPTPNEEIVSGELSLGEGEKTVTIFLPLYNGVRELHIGIEPGCQVVAPPPHRIEKPVLFYGSSITQGGCSCRTSTCYPAILNRWLGFPLINLGFSGNAMGEPFLAEYIASIPMSCFVFDYDHNAPTVEHLQKTHQPFLETILQKQPELSVILLSKPDREVVTTPAEDMARTAIVQETWQWAVSQGYNAYFIDGFTLFGDADRDCCTVDRLHPNDLGFYRMAQTIRPILETVLYR